MVQASTEIQTKIYFGNISESKFIALNETFLYVYVVTGVFGTIIIDKNLALGIFLGSWIQGIGSILLYFAKDDYYFNYCSLLF